MSRPSYSASLVVCPRCGAPAGERCVDLARYPLGWRGGVGGVVFPHEQRVAAASPRFVTVEGDRLHRLATRDPDGTLRARCGIRDPHGFEVRLGDSLRRRLQDCRNCDRALGSAS